MSDATSANFTVHVEDLGRLADARIELRPLTLFVGENNSGKSYLATLLWTLFRLDYSYLDPDTEDPDFREACDAAQLIVRELYERAQRGEPGDALGFQRPPVLGTLSTTPRYSKDLNGDARWVGWAERILARGLPERLRRVLGATHINPKIKLVTQHGNSPKFTVAFDQRTDSGGVHSSGTDGKFIDLTIGSHLTSGGDFLAEQLLRFTLVSDPWIGAYATDDPHGALYFPASRTAFLQNLPELTDLQLGRSFQRLEDRKPTRMVAPVRQFLRFLVNPGELRSDASGLAALIEGKIIGGSFQRGPGIDYQYTPDGLSTPLPMHLTSSVVTELLPLWLLVSTGRRPPLLVYEEPEAHLHPRLQRVVAVVLARLARQGTKVLVTTHSETFAQQINNLIKRSGLDPETRAATAVDFPYEADDYLSPEDVAGYEFRFRDDGRSYTERLEVRPDGIVMPMFNKELLALTDEAIRLDEALATKQAGG